MSDCPPGCRVNFNIFQRRHVFLGFLHPCTTILTRIPCGYYQGLAPCKLIRIPESGIFLLVESGILGIGIQNPAKEWIQNPFKIVETAFKRIHASTVMLRCRLQTVQSALCSLKNFDCYSQTLTNSLMTYHSIDFNTDMAKVPYSVTIDQSSTPIQNPS